MNRKSNKIQQLKKSLLVALEKKMGNVSAACKLVKCNRSTFYEYYKNDLQFKADADEIGEVALDFAEDYLFKNIKKGDTTAIIFYLKTKGKKRGYIEKQEIDLGAIKIKVSRK